ncbi:MAG: hypothetical protein A2340_02140 [Lentisphaerae bacterium RIFOXYB12_FULL_60_10]|nr:MAG: hypothetical protein A2340_02140 [Lentisphaerae bacterium RIFOXYB12_FULL_60_10]
MALVDAGLKTPESAGLTMFRKNRRLTNYKHRMSKGGIRDGSLSFDILRLGILRFRGSVGSRRLFSKRLNKRTFKVALTGTRFSRNSPHAEPHYRHPDQGLATG